jgi:hypothetical protein
MTKLEKLNKAVDFCESVNTITMFVLPALSAIFGIWSDDWRLFWSAVVLLVTVFVFGLFVVAARDRAKRTV